MAKIIDFLKDIIVKNSILIRQDNNNGSIDMKGNRIANVINETHNHNNVVIYNNSSDKKHIEEIYESNIDKISSVKLREAIIPIESLINQGKIYLAIKKYEELIALQSFSSYSKDECFSIYNGLLNCYINNNAKQDEINYWKTKILALGTEVEELYKFYFLLAINEYNMGNVEKVFIYINKSLSIKPDYINSLVTKIIVEVYHKGLSYEEAKEKLNKLILIRGLDVKEYSKIHSGYGDIAQSYSDYETAKEHYIKSNKLEESISKDINIAMCQYYLSFKKVSKNNLIGIESIEFDKLRIAEKSFKKIYKNISDESLEIIVKKSLLFYFHILVLNNKYKEILDIYEVTSYLYDNSDKQILSYVVEAQVVNGILDEKKLSIFDEFEQIRLETLYYETKKDYDKLIELLTPLFQGEYKNEKLFQILYLSSLQEKDQFDKYMEFYQEFSLHNDEVMKINYIQFLVKREEKDKVLKELKELKMIVKNPFVIYEMFIIYNKYQLLEELNDFFKKVDTGEYKIVELQMPFVFFKKMIHLLSTKEYQEYFNIYENGDLSILTKENRLILSINYYIFKHDLDGLANAYYNFFLFTDDHNELIKAVQSKLQINQYYGAEFYLELVNPMLLDKPEYYYIFKSIVLMEKGEVAEAYKQLQIVIETIDLDVDSPFHQFYFSFNMNNNRVDDAIIYMNMYISKNPNPTWFKTIQFTEDELGEEIIKKLEEAIGGKQDLDLIHKFFNNRIIGISAYNKLVGRSIEDILLFQNYPFTQIPISKGNILEIESKIEIMGKRIIIDSSTLTILSASEGLDLLVEFEEIIIPYSTMVALTERKADGFQKHAKKALNYLSQSPNVKRTPVGEKIKIDGNIIKILNDDILDCISLTNKLKVPFLNTEISVFGEIKLSEIIDINVFFSFLKENYPDKRTSISNTIVKMKEFGLEFISFDGTDMYEVYKYGGIEGIRPFLKMGKYADYSTFVQVYINFLNNLYINNSVKHFEESCIEIIRFMDRYVGKTRYYIMELIRKNNLPEEPFLKMIKKPSLSNIVLGMSSYQMIYSKAIEGIDILNTEEYIKISNILSAFITFTLKFIQIFKEDSNNKDKYLDLLVQNLIINEKEDIDYIFKLRK